MSDVYATIEKEKERNRKLESLYMRAYELAEDYKSENKKEYLDEILLLDEQIKGLSKFNPREIEPLKDFYEIVDMVKNNK